MHNLHGWLIYNKSRELLTFVCDGKEVLQDIDWHLLLTAGKLQEFVQKFQCRERIAGKLTSWRVDAAEQSVRNYLSQLARQRPRKLDPEQPLNKLETSPSK